MTTDQSFNNLGENPKFFKIIIEDNIREGRLGMPKRFMKKYGDCLSSHMILKVADGKKWKMKLSKAENDPDYEVWLQKGWKQFSQHYSLKHGYLLVFKYQQKSNFLVFIFDSNHLEINYNSNSNFEPNPNHQLNELVEIEDSQTQNRNQFQVKSYNKSKGGRISQAREAADKFTCTNPCFKVVLKCYNKGRINTLNIPIGFIRDHMKCNLKRETDTVILKVEEGKCWETKLNIYWKSCSGKLSVGWNAFVRDNFLKEKDVCVLELVGRNVLKVHIFRHLRLVIN